MYFVVTHTVPLLALESASDKSNRVDRAHPDYVDNLRDLYLKHKVNLRSAQCIQNSKSIVQTGTNLRI